MAKNGSSYQQETENVTIAIMSQKFDQSGRKNEHENGLSIPLVEEGESNLINGLETEKCDRS